MSENEVILDDFLITDKRKREVIFDHFLIGECSDEESTNRGDRSMDSNRNKNEERED